MSKAQKVLIAGQWRDSEAVGTFEPNNPSTRQPTGEVYPVSGEKEVVEAVEAAAVASEQLQAFYPDGVADFIDAFADCIEARAEPCFDCPADCRRGFIALGGRHVREDGPEGRSLPGLRAMDIARINHGPFPPGPG